MSSLGVLENGHINQTGIFEGKQARTLLCLLREWQVKCGLGNGLLRNSLSGQWATARLALQHGLHPCFINLNRDRSLQERYRQHETLVSSETQQDSFYATKRAMLNSHPISEL